MDWRVFHVQGQKYLSNVLELAPWRGVVALGLLLPLVLELESDGIVVLLLLLMMKGEVALLLRLPLASEVVLKEVCCRRDLS